MSYKLSISSTVVPRGIFDFDKRGKSGMRLSSLDSEFGEATTRELRDSWSKSVERIRKGQDSPNLSQRGILRLLMEYRWKIEGWTPRPSSNGSVDIKGGARFLTRFLERISKIDNAMEESDCLKNILLAGLVYAAPWTRESLIPPSSVPYMFLTPEDSIPHCEVESKIIRMSKRNPLMSCNGHMRKALSSGSLMHKDLCFARRKSESGPPPPQGDVFCLPFLSKLESTLRCEAGFCSPIDAEARPASGGASTLSSALFLKNKRGRSGLMIHSLCGLTEEEGVLDSSLGNISWAGRMLDFTRHASSSATPDVSLVGEKKRATYQNAPWMRHFFRNSDGSAVGISEEWSIFKRFRSSSGVSHFIYSALSWLYDASFRDKLLSKLPSIRDPEDTLREIYLGEFLFASMTDPGEYYECDIVNGKYCYSEATDALKAIEEIRNQVRAARAGYLVYPGSVPEVTSNLFLADRETTTIYH